MDCRTHSFSFERFQHSSATPVNVLEKSVIDSLLDLGADDGELLVELIDLFGEDATKRVEDVIRAEAEGDMSTTARATHVLKSASANIGALSFSRLCRDIETAAKRGGDHELHRMVGQLATMFEEVREALVALRQNFDRNSA